MQTYEHNICSIPEPYTLCCRQMQHVNQSLAHFYQKSALLYFRVICWLVHKM